MHVVFSPSSMGLISSALVIKSLTGKTKSKVRSFVNVLLREKYNYSNIIIILTS